jgi:peptidoglycan/LPS O-acetylase OafA/YrhL
MVTPRRPSPAVRPDPPAVHPGWPPRLDPRLPDPPRAVPAGSGRLTTDSAALRPQARAAPAPLDHRAGWRHQPALDGIRACAVAGVLVFHARPDWLRGGFLGVDAFFVLSGFLITGLLLGERERTGRIRLGPFWGRRARRLLPALLVVLVAVAVVSRYVLSAEELPGLRLDALAALGYVANWRMIFRGGDYFAQTAPASPLQHTWSLGIEEQFYLLWPLLVVLATLLRRRARAAIVTISLAGIAASTMASVLLYHPGSDPGRVYYGTDTRASALLVGCALAALVSGRRVRPNWLLTLAALDAAALLACAWAGANGDDAWLYQGGLTGLAVAVAVLIAHLTAAPDGIGARLLSLPPVAWLGRVSYGVYLWHWPLFQWLNADRTHLSGVALFAARIGVTVAIAAASFYLLEQPIRRGPSRRGRPVRARVLVPATVGAFTATAALVVTATAAPAQPPPVPVGVAVLPTASSAANGQPGVPPMARPGRRAGAEPRIAIFGDSVAWTIGAFLPAHPGLTVTNRAVQGCGIARLPAIIYIGTPHTNYPGCDQWDAKWKSGVAADDPDVSVILLDRWELMDRRLNGRYQHVGDPEYDAYLTRELNTAITVVVGTGARVVLLTAPYTHRTERPDGGIYPEDAPERVDAWNRLLAKVAAASPARPRLLDLNKLVCPDGKFTWSVNGLRVRSDGLHFTPAAVQQVIAPWLLPQLATMASSP